MESSVLLGFPPSPFSCLSKPEHPVTQMATQPLALPGLIWKYCRRSGPMLLAPKNTNSNPRSQLPHLDGVAKHLFIKQSVVVLTGSHNTTLRTKEHSLSFECCSLRNSVGVWGLQTIAPHLLGDKELRLGYDHITLILKLLIALTLSVVVSAHNFMQNFNCTSEQFIGFRHCKDIFIISHFPLQVSRDC